MKVEMRRYKVPFMNKWIVRVKMITNDFGKSKQFYDIILDAYSRMMTKQRRKR